MAKFIGIERQRGGSFVVNEEDNKHSEHPRPWDLERVVWHGEAVNLLEAQDKFAAFQRGGGHEAQNPD